MKTRRFTGVKGAEYTKYSKTPWAGHLGQFREETDEESESLAVIKLHPTSMQAAFGGLSTIAFVLVGTYIFTTLNVILQ